MEPSTQATGLSRTQLPLEGKGGDFALAYAWRRKWLVLLCLVVAMGLGYVYYLKKQPQFKSVTQLLIVDGQQPVLAGDLQYQSSSGDVHVALMQSHHVLDLAVKNGNLSELPSFRGTLLPMTAAVMKGLTVDLVVGEQNGSAGSIFQIAFEGPVSEDCPKVVQAVVVAYEQFLNETYDDVSQETIDLIAQAKNQLEAQVSEKEGELRRMLHDSPLLVTGEEAENVHETRMQQIEDVRSAAILENSTLQANIESLRAVAAEGVSPETLNLIVSHIEQGEGRNAELPESDLNKQSNALFSLRLEEELLQEKHGPEHPKLMAIRAQIRLTREYHAQLAAAETLPEGEQRREFYEVYIESLQARMKMNNQTIDEMGRLFDQQRLAAKDLNIYKVREETYRSEIKRKTQLFNVVLKRLDEISLLKNREGAEVQTIHPPHAGLQTVPHPMKTAAVSVVLGLMAGLGLAYGVDVADRRFRSPDEIRNDLGVPVIGHIPVIPNAGKNGRKGKRLAEGLTMAPEMYTVHSPRGRIAEACRAVRTALHFGAQGSGCQIIQVTSPSPGDGKSTVAANLAVSIANAGKRVLLLDADFRRPRVHKLLHLDNDLGMTSVIEDSAEWQDVVQSTQIENLSVLTCGKHPENPSELLASRRFEELLETFRDNFDFVLIDTPPVMTVTDPLNVAPRADAVLLVMRLVKNSRGHARRTLRSLEELGANVQGVVVNGVGSTQDGYGGYGYGGYGYGGYGGNYSNGRDRTYYAEEVERSVSV